ncbi:MAG: TPM domain-containing protein [Bacteroidales bacterium]|jgi:uncharacterized protein|nr:TPM domain-containing protein [Bacteroidales bacterium]MCI2121516.1 TPM domain-containing protein [Bacteroidales bacterium]MCI2145542.1 TPM domain-containing protein [Bacteroidales bacterium]
MKSEFTEKLSILLLTLCTSIFSFAGIPPRPVPPRLVNDLANVFTQEQVDSLEMRLVALDDSTSNQIAIVTVNSLEGETPADYALEIHRKWGVGQKDKDNGIVILYKPKTPSGNGKISISVGYGLEGAVPDAIANRIITQEMVPHFKKNDIYGGFESALDVLTPLVSGEISGSEYSGEGGGGSLSGIISLLVLFFFFPVIFIIYLVIRGIRRAIMRKHGITPPEDWIDRSNKGNNNDRWHNGGWGSGGGGWLGGGGSGGGFGGGFGGFGGGSAGGGGASGSW